MFDIDVRTDRYEHLPYKKAHHFIFQTLNVPRVGEYISHEGCRYEVSTVTYHTDSFSRITIWAFRIG